jgi:uncharacterized protein (TIGR02099 family)
MKSETYNMRTESEREAQRPGAATGRAAPWLIGLLEVLGWAAFISVAAVFLAARYWILPNIERYRDDIVAVISQAVGLRVEIGAIRADWRGLRPELDFTDVRLYDSRGRVALALPAVENVVAWSSLLFADLRLQSLTVSGPRLSLRRDASGRLHVAGLALAPGADEHGFTDWILQQREITVRDAEITWVDEQRGAPPLVLSELNFRLRNAGARHLLGIAARPPAALGSTLELRAELEGTSVTNPAAWSGRVYAELGYTDLAGWSPWVDYPVEVRRGQGAVRLWASLGSGRVLHATADLALTGVAARLGAKLPLLELSALRGRVEGRMGVAEYEFGARNLTLLREGGAAMRSTSFRLTWSPAAANRLEHGLLTANLIELEPLAQLAEYLPIPAELRQRVTELAPRGNLLDLRFNWSGQLPDAAAFSARGRFTGLGMKAWRDIPGFEGISGSLGANQDKGTLRLASRRSELELPKVFPEPRIQLEALNGNIEWTRPRQGTLEVRLSSIAFANADLAGSAFGTYSFGGAGPGMIDLSAQLSRADGRRVQKYLPLGRIMGAKTRDWLARSILAGEASDVRLRLRGDLRDFPFADPAKGEFLVAARFENGVLDYADGWPRIESIDGELQFERDHVQIVGRSGTVLGASLANVRVEIPSLVSGAKRLEISGEASGPSADFLAYVAASPVRRMVGGLTDEVHANGEGRLKLKLELPFDDLKATKIDGEFRFADNTVDLGHRLPPIEQAAGLVHFTGSSLKLSDARGRLLGGPVSFSGGSAAGKGVQIDARGSADAAGLTALLGPPWDSRISGTLAYDARVMAAEGRAQLSVESQLLGVTSVLPAPLDKAAGEALPLRVEIMTSEGKTRERISVVLGERLAAEFQRALEGATMTLRRASIEFGPAAGRALRLPERPGVLLYGSLRNLDVDSWRALFPGAGEGPGPATLDLQLGTLDAFGKRLNGVTLRASADAGAWSANLESAEMGGDLSYQNADGGKLVARLARCRIPDDAPGAGREPVIQAHDLPALDLVAESFTFRGKDLGRVEVVAQRSGADWHVERMAMTNPDATMTGKGEWRTGAPAGTSLEFQLDAKDVGKFLERIGYPGLVKGGTAKMSGSLSWRGEPLTIDYPSLAGELQLRADDGRFLEIEPGLGKLVSLMSLQMLPRRVQLDFRDVFSKGFQFESITSSLRVSDGVMRTTDFNMKGSAAEVELAGQTDLARETQDVKVRVVPSLGDSASTVVGLIHPLAGVATLLAQRVLRDPLGQMFSYRYSITGTWADPKVERLGGVTPGTTPDGGEGK